MSKITILILEDNQERLSIFRNSLAQYGKENDLRIYLRNVDQAERAIQLMNERTFDLIFLDHDLDQRMMVPIDEPNTGSTVARYINNHQEVTKEASVFIHSLNEPGSLYMSHLIEGSYRAPFLWLPAILKEALRGINFKN